MVAATAAVEEVGWEAKVGAKGAEVALGQERRAVGWVVGGPQPIRSRRSPRSRGDLRRTARAPCRYHRRKIPSYSKRLLGRRSHMRRHCNFR